MDQMVQDCRLPGCHGFLPGQDLFESVRPERAQRHRNEPDDGRHTHCDSRLHADSLANAS